MSDHKNVCLDCGHPYHIERTRLNEELAETKAELQDIKDAYKATMDEVCLKNDDRKHCTCLPYLHKGIKEKDARIAALELALKKISELPKIKPGSSETMDITCERSIDMMRAIAQEALYGFKLGDIFQSEELIEVVAKAIEKQFHKEAGICDECDGGPDKCWKSMQSFAKSAIEALRKEVRL